MISKYFDQIKKILTAVEQEEKEKLEIAAKKVAECIGNGGIIQLFGCGHSHLLAEEVFYRAGSLAPIKPIFVEPLMLHEGPVRSSLLERENNYAKTFLKNEDIHKEDIIFVISTSGRNPVPIDVALFAKERGAYVIGLTSFAYSPSLPSRHVSGKHLFECVDLAINNHSVKGDAILIHEKINTPFGPASTVIGITILHAIFSKAIVIMEENGICPPVFLSGNIDHSEEHNMKLVQKYKERIPLLVKSVSCN
ncbi:MAG TPA: SIS domain-containing protein [Anoxybacillus sp.]|jgi:uncharacterized phosphosugar-binding protein|nr:SIS domain-containing protein [Anoxybacillus sp.]